jgi:hypothetical protein
LARIRHPGRTDCNNRINGRANLFTYLKWIIRAGFSRLKRMSGPTSNRVGGVAGAFASAVAGPALLRRNAGIPARNRMSGKAFLQGRSERRRVMRAILAGLLIGSTLGLAAGTAVSRHVSFASAAPAVVQQQVISTENRTLNI